MPTPNSVAPRSKLAKLISTKLFLDELKSVKCFEINMFVTMQLSVRTASKKLYDQQDSKNLKPTIKTLDLILRVFNHSSSQSTVSQ